MIRGVAAIKIAGFPSSAANPFWAPSRLYPASRGPSTFHRHEALLIWHWSLRLTMMGHTIGTKHCTVRAIHVLLSTSSCECHSVPDINRSTVSIQFMHAKTEYVRVKNSSMKSSTSINPRRSPLPRDPPRLPFRQSASPRRELAAKSGARGI